MAPPIAPAGKHILGTLASTPVNMGKLFLETALAISATMDSIARHYVEVLETAQSREPVTVVLQDQRG